MTNRIQYRQGDIFLEMVDKIPNGAKSVQADGGRLIVARGEATGHHHSFPHRRGITMFRDDGGGSGGTLYVHTEAPSAGVKEMTRLCYASYKAKVAYDSDPTDERAAEYHRLTALAVAAGASPWEHQEHWTIAVLPGKYIVSNQQTYTPESMVRVED